MTSIFLRLFFFLWVILVSSLCFQCCLLLCFASCVQISPSALLSIPFSLHLLSVCLSVSLCPQTVPPISAHFYPSGLSPSFSPRWPCHRPAPSVCLALLYPDASNHCPFHTILYIKASSLSLSLPSLSDSNRVFCMRALPSVSRFLVLFRCTDARLGSQQLSHHVPLPSVAFNCRAEWGWGAVVVVVVLGWRVQNGLSMNIHVLLDVLPNTKVAP